MASQEFRSKLCHPEQYQEERVEIDMAIPIEGEPRRSCSIRYAFLDHFDALFSCSDECHRA